jgi:hypothetical protein
MTRRALLGLFASIAGCLGCTSKSIFVEYECFLCKGAGFLPCTGCGGKGAYRDFDRGPLPTCKSCGGSGRLRCPTCKGKRTLSNNPLAK